MKTTRLASRELVDLPDLANEAKRRRACVFACGMALREHNVNLPIVNRIFERLLKDRAVSQADVLAIQECADNLDHVYGAMRNAAEDDGTEATDLRWQEEFYRGRVVAAVAHAAKAPTAENAGEAIYEAGSAVSNLQALEAAVAAILR